MKLILTKSNPARTQFALVALTTLSMVLGSESSEAQVRRRGVSDGGGTPVARALLEKLTSGGNLNPEFPHCLIYANGVNLIDMAGRMTSAPLRFPRAGSTNPMRLQKALAGEAAGGILEALPRFNPDVATETYLMNTDRDSILVRRTGFQGRERMNENTRAVVDFIDFNCR